MHTHKAGVPCRSRIILWSWLSPTEAPTAMAPPLSPWQPGVTGSHPVCWIRESEAVRNKRLTWMLQLTVLSLPWFTQMCYAFMGFQIMDTLPNSVQKKQIFIQSDRDVIVCQICNLIWFSTIYLIFNLLFLSTNSACHKVRFGQRDVSIEKN